MRVEPGRLTQSRDPGREPEGRTMGDPAEQKPWRMAMAGRTREDPAEQDPWQTARVEPEGWTREAPA